MRYQHLYESIIAYLGKRLPEPLIRNLLQRALADLAERSHLWRARAQIATDGSMLEYALPADCLEPYTLLREDGTEVERVLRNDTLAWEGLEVWHTTQADNGTRRIVIGRVHGRKLLPTQRSYTLEYATRGPMLTGDPEQEVAIPEELVSGVESRVLEPFMSASPEMLRFHHARWRDAVALAQRIRNRLTTASQLKARLPEL